MRKLPQVSDIPNRIYRIRGQQVMLDSDLAALYQVPAKVLNQAIRRNTYRFPPEFMFQLHAVEFESIRSQFVTASRQNIRYRPFVFNEHGIAMLSSVLRSKRAIQINIAIIKAFIKMRHALSVHKDLTEKVERLEGKISLIETDVRFIRDEIRELRNTPEKTGPKIKGVQREND